jgi:hypothetical protein
MLSSRSIVAKWAWYIVLGYLAAAIFPLAILYWMLTPGSCTWKTLEKFSNLSGFDFEVSYKDCDIIATPVWIDVFVTKGSHTPKTLLLEYVPVGQGLPAIELVGANAVRMSVPRISSLSYRKDSWENLSIDYDIGIVDYPTSDADSK